jgi:16S rRNA (guanine527-N7)-methyltransferase
MITSSLIESYFPQLSDLQKKQFAQLQALYEDWNAQINVVSRKDIDLLYERHVLHSLGIAKVIQFKPQTKILDVGTGGGFPGIPLAILFPDCNFHLIDSIGKKIKVVKAVAEALDLKNMYAEQIRAEDVKDKFDFIVSRAVTAFPEFYSWVKTKIKITGQNTLLNGILYLKGGDLSEELKDFKSKIKEFPLSNYFEGEFFETKKVIYFKA